MSLGKDFVAEEPLLQGAVHTYKYLLGPFLSDSFFPEIPKFGNLEICVRFGGDPRHKL